MNAAFQLTASQLVDSFAKRGRQYQSFTQIVAIGSKALPALRAGLKNDDWQIRKWCAICLDHVADSASLTDLIPLFRDNKSSVRLWAVHSVACNHCKQSVQCPTDIVPLLIERIEVDDSIRVRRMATIMLGTEFTDPRAISVFRRLLSREDDRKIRLHAERGLERLQKAGLIDEDA